MNKLYRKGSVCYVSKSGGMSNELNNIIARSSDGVCDGVAIGGDRYPGFRFMDHFLKFESNPDCKVIVMLREVVGVDEYDVMRRSRKVKSRNQLSLDVLAHAQVLSATTYSLVMLEP